MSNNSRLTFTFSLVIAVALSASFVFKSVAQIDSNVATNATSEVKDPTVLTLIAGMKKRESQIKSVRANILKQSYFNGKSQSVSELPPDSQAVSTQPNILTQFFWVADEQRMREDERRVVPNSPRYYQMKAFNGVKLQNWSYGSSVAFETQADTLEQSQMGFLNTELQTSLGVGMRNYSLIKQFEDHNPKFLGKESIGGVETYKLESQKGSQLGFTGTWWIAPSKSYLIIKFESRPVEAVAGASPEWRHVRIVDETTENKDGIWFPTVSRYNVYSTSKQFEAEEWLSLDRYSISDLEVNKPIGNEVFELNLPLGTKVLGDQNQNRIVGGDVSEFEAQIRKAQPDDKYLSDVPLDENGGKTP